LKFTVTMKQATCSVRTMKATGRSGAGPAMTSTGPTGVFLLSTLR